MVKLVRFYLFIFFVIFPFFLFGQSDDVELNKLKAREFFAKGRELSGEGKNVEALDAFKLYLDYRKKAYGEENYFLGSAYSAVGIAYKNLGELMMALQNFKQAEKNYLLRNNPNLGSLGRLYINIGNVYRAKLDYANALNYYKQALLVFENQPKTDLYEISGSRYSIIEIYYLQKEYDLVVREIEKVYHKSDSLYQIDFCNILAGSYQVLKRYNEAEIYFLEGITLIKSLYGKEDIELAYGYINYAKFLSEVNRFEEAVQIMNQAYGIIHKYQNSDGSELSMYYTVLGDLYKDKPIATQNLVAFKQQKKENLNEAIGWYNKSLEALDPGDTQIQPASINIGSCLSFMDCLEVLKDIADTYRELALLDKEERSSSYVNSLNDALEYYEAISHLIQRARQEISSDESKIQLAVLEHSTFSKSIETAYLAYEATREENYFELAFNYSEQIKSSAVFDKISNDLAQENSLIPDSLLEQEKRLNSTISIYAEKIYQENTQDKPDTVLLKEYESTVFNATRQRDELNQYFEEEYPDYYDLKYSNSMLSVADVQSHLKNKEVVLEYVMVKQEENVKNVFNGILYSFLISKDSKKFIKQSIDAQTNSSLEEVFRFMSTPDYIFTKNEDAKQFCISSHQAYRLLISPFESEVKEKSLIVIPDGKLNYISFDALLKTLPDTSEIINFAKLDYLIKDLNINYANSANILMKNRSSKRQFKNNILAFAPEYNSERFELSNASYTLMPLPGVKKEVETISKTVKTDVFLAAEASESNFREKCKNYDILHLAMHAYINDSLPAYSRLAFSPVLSSDSINSDGWLNTADIYNLELNARLTVLSACNTGLGRLQKGEGLMSLARGFLYAGCPAVIMSLWEVEDEAGTKIMTSFYKNLKRGKNKDEALRLAKLQYLENSNSRLAHPHYWMSFKCIGDNSPIYTSYDIYFFALLILLIFAFTVDQIVRVVKIRNQRKSG